MPDQKQSALKENCQDDRYKCVLIDHRLRSDERGGSAGDETDSDNKQGQSLNNHNWLP
jgi:hypothetical protein